MPLKGVRGAHQQAAAPGMGNQENKIATHLDGRKGVVGLDAVDEVVVLALRLDGIA